MTFVAYIVFLLGGSGLVCWRKMASSEVIHLLFSQQTVAEHIPY